jgi:hypothetical protein
VFVCVVLSKKKKKKIITYIETSDIV